MAHYYVGKQPQFSGDHEVHKSDCQFLPPPEQRLHLGEFLSCQEAIREARRHYQQVNGCFFCLRACHTQ